MLTRRLFILSRVLIFGTFSVLVLLILYFGDVLMTKLKYLFFRVRDFLSKSLHTRLISYILISVIAVLVGILVAKTKYSLLTIKGNSMRPTYKPQDILLCEKHIDVLKRGDVIDIDTSEEHLAQKAGASEEICKRVIALEGDTISFTDKVIYINGRELNEPYAYLDGYKYTNFEGTVEYTVPKNSVYVMGDNRVLSLDSRAYGVISVDSINGRVIKNFTTDYGFTMHRLRITLISILALAIVMGIWSKLSKAGKVAIHKLRNKNG